MYGSFSIEMKTCIYVFRNIPFSKLAEIATLCWNVNTRILSGQTRRANRALRTFCLSKKHCAFLHFWLLYNMPGVVSSTLSLVFGAQYLGTGLKQCSLCMLGANINFVNFKEV